MLLDQSERIELSLAKIVQLRFQRSRLLEVLGVVQSFTYSLYELAALVARLDGGITLV